MVDNILPSPLRCQFVVLQTPAVWVLLFFTMQILYPACRGSSELIRCHQTDRQSHLIKQQAGLGEWAVPGQWPEDPERALPAFIRVSLRLSGAGEVAGPGHCSEAISPRPRQTGRREAPAGLLPICVLLVFKSDTPAASWSLQLLADPLGCRDSRDSFGMGVLAAHPHVPEAWVTLC